MGKKILKKSDVVVDHDFFCIEENGKIKVNFYIETWFDVDRYFNEKTEGTDDYINMYVNIDENNNVTASYCIVSDTGNGNEYHDWELSEEEKTMFLELCNDTVLEEEHMNISEFITANGYEEAV